MIPNILDVLRKAIDSGAQVVMSKYGTDLVISTKSNPQDYVTQADIETQRAIQNSLIDQLTKLGIEKSEIGFIGEESLFETARHLFIIDPIDGTSSFIKGNGEGAFCISIAYAFDQKITAGMVFDPLKEIYYSVHKGQGAYKATIDSREKLTIIDKNDLLDCAVGYNLGSDPVTKNEISLFGQKLQNNVASLTRSHSCILTCISVCTNEFQLIFSGKTFIWDVAVVQLLLEESGGVLTDWGGNVLVLDFDKPNQHYKILAGNTKTITKILAL